MDRRPARLSPVPGRAVRTALALAAVALGTGAGLWHVLGEAPVYVGSVTVLLSAPAAPAPLPGAQPLDANQLAARYLSYPTSLGVTAQVVARSLDERRPALGAAGLHADFDIALADRPTTIQYVAPDLRQVAPDLLFTVRSRSAADAHAALGALVGVAAADLAQRQQAAGGPVGADISAAVLGAPSVTAQTPGSRPRAAAAVLLLGLAAGRILTGARGRPGSRPAAGPAEP